MVEAVFSSHAVPALSKHPAENRHLQCRPLPFLHALPFQYPAGCIPLLLREWRGAVCLWGVECGTLICMPCMHSAHPWLHQCPLSLSSPRHNHTAPLPDHSMATFSPQACHAPLAPSPVLYRPVAGERAGRAQVSTQVSPPRSSTVRGRGELNRILRCFSVLGFLPNGGF